MLYFYQELVERHPYLCEVKATIVTVYTETTQSLRNIQIELSAWTWRRINVDYADVFSFFFNLPLQSYIAKSQKLPF